MASTYLATAPTAAQNLPVKHRARSASHTSLLICSRRRSGSPQLLAGLSPAQVRTANEHMHTMEIHADDKQEPYSIHSNSVKGGEEAEFRKGAPGRARRGMDNLNTS